jgi:hypothetical protein
VLLISIYILLANLKSKSDDAKETKFHKEI